MTKHTHRTTRLRWLVASLSLLVAAACTSAATGSTTGSTTSPRSTPSATPSGIIVTRTFLGAGQHPAVTVEAPSTKWTPFKEFALTNDCCGVAFWDVGMVARNPCHSIGNLVDPGPTVEDLVTALEAQPMRHATPPTNVTLAGYQGKYLEWSVPKDWVVTGDGNFKGCDVQSDGSRDFVSWLGAGGIGQRWQQEAGQVDRLWILNVNGQRLVIDASHAPGTTQAQLAEQAAIVRSVRFAT
jgi:hypothetical protein